MIEAFVFAEYSDMATSIGEGIMVCRLALPSIMTVLVCVSVLCLGSVAGASEYMPLDPGLWWTYTNGVEARVGEANSMEAFPLHFWGLPSSESEITYWLIDDVAGPLLTGITFFQSKLKDGRYSPYSWYVGLETAIRLFELPLTEGAELFDVVPTTDGDVWFLRTVEQLIDLETPYGVLPVYEVTLWTACNAHTSAHFYVHDQLGPVGYNGALLTNTSVPVAVETTSWSKIKCLYRQ